MSDDDKKKPASPHNDAGPLPNPKQEHVSPKAEGETTTTCVPDPDAAIRFMYQMYPVGPWLLVAIAPEKAGPPLADTFGPDREHEAREFLAEHNGRRNLYFSVAAPRTPLRKKALKTDLRHTRHLHVDIDPRAGEPLADEQARISALLTTKLPEGLLPPTTVVFSGGGYQAFWELAEPFAIEGDPERCALLEAHNRAIEVALGGDSCHNADRIMRLPGTVNLPDARKREKGRLPVLAEVLEHHPERTYRLEQFASAPRSAKGELPARAENRQVSPIPVSDLTELDQWGIGDTLKVVIARGEHPDKPKQGDNSRSAWLFRAVCQLLRAGVPDATVLGIITDRGFGISESVLDKGGRALGYAWRQIERAKERIAADALEFQRTKEGLPCKSQHNVRVAIRKLGVSLRHDQFANRLTIEGLEGFGPELDDPALDRLWLQIDEEFNFQLNKELFYTIVKDAARRSSFHPVHEYLGDLVWDGVPRLDGWLVQYAGAPDTPYVRAVGALTLIAAVRRVRSPGCKFDEMLVLESPQGLQKSSALRVLAVQEEWFSDDLPLNADGKRAIESLSGRWIVEAAELKGMRRGDVEHLKSFLSRQVDRARMSYDRLVTVVPRQCVFIGTTNSVSYLRDGTGNRRFWPVRVERFDVEALRRDRDQLWAEAAARETAGEDIRLDPSLYADAAAEQEVRRSEDPFVHRLTSVLGDLVGKLRAEDAFDIVGVMPGQRTQDHNTRLGEAMRELGWERKKLRFGGLHPEHCYVRGDKAQQETRIIVHRYQDGSVQAHRAGEEQAPF